MSRRLNDLSSRFRPLAVELLARLVEAQIPVLIIDTLRTPAEQAEYIRRGVSWTPNSRHLTGDAIDVCPYLHYEQYGPDKLNWNGSDPVWIRIGAIGKGVGLKWGGDWKQRDLGHFEYAGPETTRNV